MNNAAKLQRLESFIELLDVFPSTTHEGRRQYELYKRKLNDEFATIQNQNLVPRFNMLAMHYTGRNHLTTLKPL